MSPGYFSTLGIALQKGRLLTPADRAGAELVAVVNTELVRRFFPNEDPIGKRFRRHAQAPWASIVGVVSDVRREGKSATLNPQVYFPAAQTALYPVRLSEFSFRSASEPKKLISAVQQQVWAIDKDLPVTNIRTYDEIISQSVAERRFQTTLLGLFASLALILAMVGIYGVISYSVSQRTSEIGIRMALGASRGGILKMVMGRAMLLTLIGIIAGAAGCVRIFAVPEDPALRSETKRPNHVCDAGDGAHARRARSLSDPRSQSNQSGSHGSSALRIIACSIWPGGSQGRVAASVL